MIKITGLFGRYKKKIRSGVGRPEPLLKGLVVAVEQILVSWVGAKDLAAGQEGAAQPGLVAQVLATHNFDRVELLYNYPESKTTGYLEWLQSRTEIPDIASLCRLSSPVNFGEIHLAAKAALTRLTAVNSVQ